MQWSRLSTEYGVGGLEAVGWGLGGRVGGGGEGGRVRRGMHSKQCMLLDGQWVCGGCGVRRGGGGYSQ